MKHTLTCYLDHLWRHGDHGRAVVAAAEAVAADPWQVVAQAGLLARCVVQVAPRDLHLGPDLRPRRAGIAVPAGAPYPVLGDPGRRRKGAFDTPPEMARRLVALALAAGPSPRVALDPACGPGGFLVALTEAGVPDVRGGDLDALAVEVARLAAPRARVEVLDGLADGEQVDLVIGNPPYVPPERQDKALRKHLQRRFPWLLGRFDLAVPFAAVATSRVRDGGVLALVLPSAALSQPYGTPLRREWLTRHRLVALQDPEPFPGASVHVSLVVLQIGAGPCELPVPGVSAAEVLRLPHAPLDPSLQAGDVALIEAVRARSVPLGDLAKVDTGVVAHLPGGSREALLHDEPGPGRVPYADAKELFAGRHRWLHYLPERMSRAKQPQMFERPKLVVQRIRGAASVRAVVERQGIYVGHTCTVICPYDERISLERLRDLVVSPLLDALTRLERGQRMDLYPRDVAAFPVPRRWLETPDLPLAEAWGLTEGQVARLRAHAAPTRAPSDHRSVVPLRHVGG